MRRLVSAGVVFFPLVSAVSGGISVGSSFSTFVREIEPQLQALSSCRQALGRQSARGMQQALAADARAAVAAPSQLQAASSRPCLRASQASGA